MIGHPSKMKRVGWAAAAGAAAWAAWSALAGWRAISAPSEAERTEAIAAQVGGEWVLVRHSWGGSHPTPRAMAAVEMCAELLRARGELTHAEARAEAAARGLGVSRGGMHAALKAARLLVNQESFANRSRQA